ncbi:hypothetical protein [Dactylosporangium sp. CA-233914]|uniref:hypothetical protein n=1 Tax=Dactylosporangium sp. CA-233914 TaxID=3239934 RepID=UPI003D8CD307
MASSIGIVVLAVLWLACAAAALHIAVRLARQHERRMRHAHGDEHAWIRPRHGRHERPRGTLRTALRHWATASRRRRHRARGEGRPAGRDDR